MANQYTKLFIDGQQIDLFKSEELPLNITRRVNSVDGKVQGDYSRASIKVPATKNNVAVLGNSRAFKPFRIEVDGSPSFNGTARVRKGRIYSQAYAAIKETYEINLVSNNSSWFVSLGDTLLSELTDVIIQAWTDTATVTGFESRPDLREWGFTFIKYKEWATRTGTPPNVRDILSWLDSTPVLFIWPFIENAFASIGYTVQSEFMNTDFFQKLVLPTPIPERLSDEYAQQYLNLVASQTTPFTFPVGSTTGNYPFNVIESAPPANPNAYDNITTYLYTAPETGYYQVSIEFRFGATPPPPPYTFFITLQVNGVDVLPRIGFAFSNVPGGPQYPVAGTVLRATGVVFLNAGDTTAYNYITNGGITVERAVMTIKGEAVKTAGMTIDFKYLLKDWLFVDMLKGLTSMFNLAFETDEDARTVTIEPKDAYILTERIPATTERKEGFYKDVDQKDYSKLIDYKRKGTFEFPNVKGSYNFIYESDNEETIEYLEQNNVLQVYEGRYPMASGSDTSKVEKKEVPFFKKTIHVLDELAKFPDTNVTPQFPLIYPQNYVLDPTATENDNDYGPRILYFAGQRFGYEDLDGQIEVDVFSPDPILVPMCFMVNYNDTTGLDPNLGFNNENIFGVESPGLLQRYHLQDMTRLDKGELRENYVQFNSIDNLVFSFRLKAYIDAQKYVVQEIEGYNPLKDTPTNFKFFLDVFPSQEDVDNIINTPVNSVVSLVSEIP